MLTEATVVSPDGIGSVPCTPHSLKQPDSHLCSDITVRAWNEDMLGQRRVRHMLGQALTYAWPASKPYFRDFGS
jgi:hypothetical protein